MIECNLTEESNLKIKDRQLSRLVEAGYPEGTNILVLHFLCEKTP